MTYAAAVDLLYTAHVPAGEGPFPTIVFLHGWGASAHDLLPLAPLFHRGEALVLCPQGRVEVPVGQGLVGYGWFPISDGGAFDPAGFAKGAELVRGFIDQALGLFPIERRKLVVIGFSQGGVMAYDLVLRDPARFAGLAALSSWLPPSLSDQVSRQPEFETLPVMIMHGTSDDMVPVQRAQESRDALRALGISPTYREYEMEHGIGPDALRDLVRWLEEKVVSPIHLV